MDQALIDKYFRDQCTDKEIEQVLDWFETAEGQTFLEEDIEEQSQRFTRSSDLFLYPEINSEKLFNRIQLHKKNDLKQHRWFAMRVASIVLIAAVLSSLLYWSGLATGEKQQAKPAIATYITAPGQQKIFRLSDGTKIRLNENSKLMVTKITQKNRTVNLKGEAYFEVPHDPAHPFVVHAWGAEIKDLGTKFNVRTDMAAGNVQVAVIQGKVALKKKETQEASKALLTRNHFATLRLSDGQITIERGPVENYLSWINMRLIFKGDSLVTISRQLERLYDVNIQFETKQLKKLNLTANFEKQDLRKTLTVISNTLDIHFKMNKNRVIWKQ